MVLVVGATGMLGTKICRLLALRGTKVRAFVRPTSAEPKVLALQALGVELFVGDLKDPNSIAAACAGVEAIVSTASSTFSRQEGDSIETVDGAGQLSLVEAAKAANIQRFLFISFRHSPAMPYALAAAKGGVERAISSMNFTVIQASFFMESWLSPALGFDAANGTARIYGTGKSPISWVSCDDVAKIAVLALMSKDAERKTIEFGGPNALNALEVVAIFERATNLKFKLEFVPEEFLLAQYRDAIDPMQKSFAALMLGAAGGDAVHVNPIVGQLGIRLTSVEEYAAHAMSQIAG